jgi:hypothetical protein
MKTPISPVAAGQAFLPRFLGILARFGSPPQGQGGYDSASWGQNSD